MLRSVKEIIGYKLLAHDGEFGKVKDLLFDDRNWIMRYLVVDTGGWLENRKVLITPVAVAKPDWKEKVLPITVTKDVIESAPPLSADEPVSKQHEKDLHAYFGWTPYWIVRGGAMPPLPENALPGVDPEALNDEEKSSGANPHLRSTDEVEGYHTQAVDGEIGHVHDFILNDDMWGIQYLVIDTRNILPGRKVLIAPLWVNSVDWQKRMVEIELDKDMIKSSPEYDPAEPVNRAYEEVLYDYYGRPKYWTK